MADDSELRELIVRELATATRATVNDGTVATYLKALERFETDVLAEGCSRLMQTAKFFPSVSEVRESCRMVVAESERAEAGEIYRDRELMPQARAEMWMEHLKAVCKALRDRRDVPPPPVVLDSAAPVYRCSDCQDTGFKRACWCNGANCRTCRYHYVADCHCKPPRPEPIQVQEKRYRRAR